MRQTIQKKTKKVLVEGAIPPDFIAESIAKHQTKTTIGAHDIFLGQVRADEFPDGVVHAIEYSAYEEMAEKAFHEIREQAFEKFNLTCMHIYHSLGEVKAGEICLFVFVSSPHRQGLHEALSFIVEAIKEQVPVFGRELFEDGRYVWKENA